MKKSIIFALFCLVVLAFGCIGPPPAPKLSLENVVPTDEYSLSGCSAKVTGFVKNAGDAKAEGVSLSCFTMQEGAVIDSNTKALEDIAPSTSATFTLNLNTDCLKGQVTYNCSATCKNC